MENKNFEKTIFLLFALSLIFSTAGAVTAGAITISPTTTPKIGDNILITVSGTAIPSEIKIVESVSNNLIDSKNSSLSWNTFIDSKYKSGQNYTVIADYGGGTQSTAIFSVTKSTQINVSDVPFFFIPLIVLMVFLIVRKK